MAYTDTFAGTNGDELPTYDANWVEVNGGAGVCVIDNAEHCSWDAGFDNSHYVNKTETPSSADYLVQADINAQASYYKTIGISVRSLDSAITCYTIYHVDATVGWRLSRFVGGSETALANVTGYAPNTTRDVKLQAITNGSGNVDLSVWLDGNLEIEYEDSDAAKLTATGWPAIHQNFANNHQNSWLDNFHFENVSTGITINANTDTLVITENSSVVGLEIPITAGADSLIISEQASTVQINHNIAASTDILIITENTSTIIQDHSVAASLDTLVINEQSANVQINHNISGSLDALVISENSANVQINHNIGGTLDTLIISEQSANVATSIPILANTDTLSISEQSSSVQINYSISGSLDTLVISEQSANIQINHNITTSLDTLTITEQAATVAANTLIEGNLDTLVITEQVADVNIDHNISGSFDTLIITEQSSDISIYHNITPSLDTLIISEQLADVNINHNISSSLDTLVITENLATVQINHNVASSVDSLVISEQAATITFDVILNASFDTLVISPKCANPHFDLYDPEFEFVVGEDSTAVPSVSEPSKGTYETDATYGVYFQRLTDHATEAPVGFARNTYSRINPYNVDSCRILIMAEDGFVHMYDSDGNYIDVLPTITTNHEYWWDSTRDNIIWHGNSFGGMKMFNLDINTGVSTEVGDFTGRLPWETAAFCWTKQEGSPSQDMRYWGFMVDDSGFSGLGAFIWDAVTDTIGRTIDFDTLGVGRPDHTSMSPTGDYLIVSWDSAGAGYGTYAFHRTDSEKDKQLHHKSEHSDLGLLSNGHDYYISVAYQNSSTYTPAPVGDVDLNGGDVFFVDIETGVFTTLFDSYDSGSTSAFHFSGKNYDVPGWTLVSSYAGNAVNNWFKHKVFLLSLESTPTIINLAHHHSEQGSYWAEPHACINWDASKIIYNSNWDNTGDPTDVDAYQIILPVPFTNYLDHTINGITDALVITEQPCLVGISIDITSATDALVISEQAASIDVSHTILCNTDALVIQEQVSAVGISIDVSTTEDALTITEQAAIVGLSIDIGTSVDSLSIAENNAIVTIDHILSASVDNLIITEQNSVVNLTDGSISISAATDSLLLTEFTATVRLITTTTVVADIVDSIEGYVISSADTYITTIEETYTSTENTTITNDEGTITVIGTTFEPINVKVMDVVVLEKDPDSSVTTTVVP